MLFLKLIQHNTYNKYRYNVILYRMGDPFFVTLKDHVIINNKKIKWR
jgi:hypothetical protein